MPSAIPLVISFHRLRRTASLDAAVLRALARIDRLGVGVTGCRIRIEAPRLQDLAGLPAGVRVEVSRGAASPLEAVGPVGRADSMSDVTDAVRRAFATLERGLWRLEAAAPVAHHAPTHVAAVRTDPHVDRTGAGVDFMYEPA